MKTKTNNFNINNFPTNKSKKLKHGDVIAGIVIGCVIGVALIIFLILYFTHKLDHSKTPIKLCQPLTKHNPNGIGEKDELIYSGNYNTLQKNTCYNGHKDIIYEGIGFVKESDLHTKTVTKEIGDSICQKHGYKQMCSYINVPPKCGGLNNSDTGYFLAEDKTVKSGLWTRPGNIGWNSEKCLPAVIKGKHAEGIYCCNGNNFTASKDHNIETYKSSGSGSGNTPRNNFRDTITAYESSKIENKLNNFSSEDKNNNKFNQIIKCFDDDSQAMNAGIFNELSYCNSKTDKIRSKKSGEWQNSKDGNCYCNYAYDSTGKKMITPSLTVLCENNNYINLFKDSSSSYLDNKTWCNKDKNILYYGNNPSMGQLNNTCFCK